MAKLSDKVIAAIQRDIAKGTFKTGEKIPAEPELMHLYNVGRSTVREAVKTLAISGILSVKQGDGTYVNGAIQRETLDERLRRADAVDINSVRVLLEEEIVRLAASHKTPEDIIAISQWLDKRAKAIAHEQAKECADADIGFHLALATASGNAVLADLYKGFTVVMREYFDKRDATTVRFFAASHDLHVELFEAIKNGKPRQAVSVVKQIIANNK
ncbi:DNA-binding transcriptional regulator, FadR family [Filimonas lacunae]|uniref:DNA-binding transcriptional regulator, FadR family n=1 Tax=Filimonas lacunae TaxID=477680 RepID=A0A173ML53_9BACT|nr:FadR/GntR family transcriptional regulator [Filimonas lacunae]BAV08372.1 transcriptional regulator, GntR family [Filimonas lacunae]SIT33467.1 DNA-binding transcriptional regulator, FadR family [Filimonas lacunae]